MKLPRLWLIDIVIILVVIFAIGFSFSLGYHIGKNEEIAKQQHDLCYDTKTHEAWVARKGDSMRCFMEHKEYPHRVKGSYLD